MLLIMTLFSSFRAAVGTHVSCACWCGSFPVRILHAQPVSPPAPVPSRPGALAGPGSAGINASSEVAQCAHS